MGTSPGRTQHGDILKKRESARRRISSRGRASEHFHAKEQAANTSLDPVDWTGFRQQAHRMLDDMLGYTENIRDYPVWQAIPNEVRAHFREALPSMPTSLAKVHEEFMTTILPFAARNAHPGFLGWVQGGGTPVGMMAEMLSAGLTPISAGAIKFLSTSKTRSSDGCAPSSDFRRKLPGSSSPAHRWQTSSQW